MLELLQKLCSYINIKVNNNIILETMIDLNVLHNSKNLLIKDNNNKKWNNELYRKTLLTQSHNTSGGKIGKYIEKYTIEENNHILNDEEIKLFLKKYNYLDLELELRLKKSNLIL